MPEAAAAAWRHKLTLPVSLNSVFSGLLKVPACVFISRSTLLRKLINKNVEISAKPSNAGNSRADHRKTEVAKSHDLSRMRYRNNH